MEEYLLEPVKQFLSRYNIEFQDYQILIFLSILVFCIGYVIKYFLSKIKDDYLLTKKGKDLHPFFTKSEIKEARKYYIRTNVQNLPTSSLEEPIQVHAKVIKQDALDFFLKVGLRDSDQRFYLVLADSGMGKTTFMINLYFKYLSKILQKYLIRILPLNSSLVDKEIEKIIEAGKAKKTILLLDAFDEDPKAFDNWKERIRKLTFKTQSFRKIIITSRTQFFPNEKEEPAELRIPKSGTKKGMHNFQKLYISPFDDNDIRNYLNKRYNFLFFPKKRLQKWRAYQIVKSSPNLMVRPMLLNYIEDLVDTKIEFTNTFQIYDILINKWIQREANLIPIERKEKFKENLNFFSINLSKNLYHNRIFRRGYTITNKEIQEIANTYQIELTNLEMRSKSLLNRDAKGNYKFSHKSIMEYFLAIACTKDDEFRKIVDFTELDQAKFFFKELNAVRYVLKYLKSKGINVSSKRNNTLNIYFKTITVNKQQFHDLLKKLKEDRFLTGFNDLSIDNLFIKENDFYDLEQLGNVTCVKKISYYSSVLKKKGNIKELNKFMPKVILSKEQWNY